MTKDMRWRPERGGTYYFIYSNGAVGNSTWKNDPTDKSLFERGNCFRTEAKAEAAAEKVKALMLDLHETSSECDQLATDCNQLPKLTTDVFNHPACPKWARWAALSGNGMLTFYEDKPRMSKDEYPKRWINYYRWYPVEGTKFDSSDWQNSLIERPAKALPKLTVEVFNRPGCPEWANFAMVNGYHRCLFMEHRPWQDTDGSYCHGSGMSKSMDEWEKFDLEYFYIERPEETLPNWCMIDNICWHKRCGYFKVTNIDEFSKRVDIQQVEDNSKGYLSFHTVCNEVMQANLRPFNTKEMKALVGRTIAPDYGAVFLVTKFVDTREGGEVCVDSIYYNADRLLDEFTIDGKPCGKLEHLNEKGEWVE